MWRFVNRHDNIIRMETATALGCVAIEPLGPYLQREFRGQINDRFKQAIGFLARQVMEGRGYRVVRSGVRIPRKGGLFDGGTKYALQETPTSTHPPDSNELGAHREVC